MITPEAGDALQFDCAVGQSGACAVSGAGWQKVSISFSSVFNDNSFLLGRNGIFDATAPVNGGNGELVNVSFLTTSNGTNVEFRTDNWAFTTVVPVPAAAWLFSSALIGLAGISRKR